MMVRSCTYLLLALALTFFSGGNSQCRENDIENIEVSQHCSIIHDALETALVRTDNLYQLRVAFYPSSHVSPALLKVQYNIQRANNITLTVLLGWTESGVFAAINPQTLYDLQLRALYHALKELVLEPRTITLSLDVQNSAELTDVLDSEMEDMLHILNARLKVYATMYEELERWDGTNIGYTWDVRHTSTALLPITVILSTPIAALVFVILFSALRGIVDDSPSLEFLYGLEIPALIITFVEFVTSIILWANCSTFSCVVKASTPIAIFIFAVCFEVHLLIHGFVNVKRLSNCKRYVKLSYLFELFFLNFVFFKALIALVSISFIPLILLIIVYPAEILCTILIYFAVIILFTLLLSPFTYIIAFKSKDITDKLKKIKKKGYWQLLWSRCRKKDSEDDPPDSAIDGGTDTERPEATQTVGPRGTIIDEDTDTKMLYEWVWMKCIENKEHILVLVGVFNVALVGLLLSLLYMQALLSGATSSVVVNYLLIIITALVPGALVVGTKRALKRTKKKYKLVKETPTQTDDTGYDSNDNDSGMTPKKNVQTDGISDDGSSSETGTQQQPPEMERQAEDRDQTTAAEIHIRDEESIGSREHANP